MKRGLLIVFLVLAGMLAAALQGCKGGGKIEPEEPIEEPLLIDTTIVVPATGGKNRFSIISHSRWKTSVVSGAAWCHVTPADGGSGGSTIAVTCDPNDEFAVRQALVRIDNATTHGTIAVIQQQIDVLDLTVDDECEFGPQGGNFAAKLDYNIDYTVTFSADWVRQVQTKAPLHADLMFEVDKNNSGADRQCEVTVAGGDFSHTVTVSQIAAYITLSIDDVALEASVTRLPVMVESNVSYVSYLPEDAPWLSITGETSGGTDGQKSSMIFDLAIEENEGWFLREGIVSFGNPDYNLTGSLHILHKAVDIMYASLPLFEFGPEGGSFEFDTDPTKEYKFTVDGADWIKVSTPEGSPARRIITVDKSLLGEGRTASLTISRGNAKKTLDFSQAGVAPEFSAQELRFASAGGSQILSVTGSVEYTLVPPEDAPWCTVAAAEDGGYTVTVAANDAEQSRTCRIGFVNKEYEVSETVTVLQAQKDAFEVNPQSFSFGPEGGKAEVDIHTNIGYTCESDAPEWISGDAGTTGGKREFTVALNDSGKARQGRLTFTAEGFEKIVSIDQEAAFITASQHDIEYNDQPFEGSFEVSANVPFLAKTLGDGWFSMEVSGTNVTFSATENNEWGSRLAEIVLYNSTYKASDTVYVRQGAKYYLDIKQMEFDLTPAGGTVALEVSSNKEYTYYIDGSPDWISEVSPLVFEVAPNLGSQARDVRIVFEQNGKSKSVSIWQDAPALVVSPARLEFAAAGGEDAISITGNVGFTVSQPSEDWAQCSGTASSCTISVAPNPEPEMRSCTIEISSAEFGRTVTVEVVQAAKGIFELLTDSFSLGPEGGEITIEVNTNVDFTSSSKADWISGEGLSYTVAANASGEERSGTVELMADGYTYPVTVTQDAAVITVDTEHLEFPVGGGTLSFSVTSNVEYELSIPDEEWISCTSVGDGQFEVTAPANETELRECTV
ncbi:MAG: BACON domain-containing protein, partial [Bacteroidales bacterium]|nr:BACON domain-containing protein [Bacteroidales bacterium]